jgi:hypothetical protein
MASSRPFPFQRSIWHKHFTDKKKKRIKHETFFLHPKKIETNESLKEGQVLSNRHPPTMNRTKEVIAAMSPERKRAWMQERKLVVAARAELEAEVDAEIQAEEDRKKRKKLCQVPHNTNYCYSCGNRKVIDVSSHTTGWYVQDRHNEMHKQRT